MSELSAEEIRKAVRRNYGGIAQSGSQGCGCAAEACCGEAGDSTAGEASLAIGYSLGALSSVPEGSNMGLGCGNPLAIASLKAGETVLDLGSGGGFDCFLAAEAVGEDGTVIGVDATPEMVCKARGLAAENGFENVEFRLGEIENLPVADNIVDVIISNCVINLSPEKARVFEEAFRVLRPGGRVAISDVVATAELPAEVRDDLSLYTGCVAGASLIDDLEAMLKRAGFVSVQIEPKDESKAFIREWAPGMNVEDFVVSAIIEADKPSQ
jgi:ubiquinone/menaquinone biosynthesis C-methylase UbiE